MIDRNKSIYSPERSNLLKLKAVGAYQEVLSKWYRQSQGEVIPGTNIVCILTSGMRLGAYTAAQLSALERIGFKPEGIQSFVGTSVGATIGREFIGANIDELAKLFANDIIDGPKGRQRGIFLETRKLPLVDFVVTEDLFRDRGARESAVKSAIPELYMALRGIDTGRVEFAKARDMDDTVIGVLSSMTIDSITKRNSTKLKIGDDKKGRMFADPLIGETDLINYAINELGATDLLIFFNSNPFINSTTDRLLNYVLTILEHRKNPKHLIWALSELKSRNSNPAPYYQQLLTSENVCVAGIYPENSPLAPNDLRLNRIQRIMSEAESFAYSLGQEVITNISPNK